MVSCLGTDDCVVSVRRYGHPIDRGTVFGRQSKRLCQFKSVERLWPNFCYHPPCENVQEIAMRSRSDVHASLVLIDLIY